MASLSRRSFLAASGAVALGGPALLAACGGGTAKSPLDGADVVGRWNTYVLVPGKVRLPAAFGKAGVFFTDGPETVSGRIVDATGNVVLDKLSATKRNSGIPNAYWPFEVELTKPGVYQLQIDGASPTGQAFQINDPASVVIPKVGEKLPPFDTPTDSDHRGVEPICTRTPECPLHTITLTEALAQGKPVAYLIGTPAHCQTGFCGPILDLLLELRDEFGDKVNFVHADVYSDETLTAAAPALLAYHLEFEPVLYVAGRTGTISARLDAAFDKTDMRAAIAAVA